MVKSCEYDVCHSITYNRAVYYTQDLNVVAKLYNQFILEEASNLTVRENLFLAFKLFNRDVSITIIPNAANLINKKNNKSFV